MQHTITITIPEVLEPRLRDIEDVEMFISVLTIEALQKNEASEEYRQLAEAAQIMCHEYLSDAELISFTALDGEPIYE